MQFRKVCILCESPIHILTMYRYAITLNSSNERKLSPPSLSLAMVNLDLLTVKANLAICLIPREIQLSILSQNYSTAMAVWMFRQRILLGLAAVPVSRNCLIYGPPIGYSALYTKTVSSSNSFITHVRQFRFRRLVICIPSPAQYVSQRGSRTACNASYYQAT